MKHILISLFFIAVPAIAQNSDINGNGTVSIADLTEETRFLTDSYIADDSKQHYKVIYDYDGDGKITLQDVSFIAEEILGISRMEPRSPFTIKSASVLSQHNMSSLDSHTPAGNYSGITWIGDNRYALVSEEQEKNGWYEFTIDFNQQNGDITSMKYVTFHASDVENELSRDGEGIIYNPSTKTFFICAESDQQIIELDMNSRPTGRSLAVPREFAMDKILANTGFEALAYDTLNHIYWTTTEQSLLMDSNGSASGYGNNVSSRHRLLAFDEDLHLKAQWPYISDVPSVSSNPKLYAFGIPELTAMPDGSLLVLEREFYVAEYYIGSYVTNKLYHIRPEFIAQSTFDVPLTEIASSAFLPKTKIAEWKTQLLSLREDIANYEGMCLAPPLPDGRIPLVVVSDSQNRYGNSLYHLKDCIRVVLLEVSQ